jgi:ribonucleoside-diphosphate reductase beta chain
MSDKCLLYSNEKIDFLNEPMFFGSGKNTQRFDIMKYEWFDTSNNTQQGQDWAWDEITISQDVIDHTNKLTEAMQFVVKKGLQRAIFLDSLNGRGPVAMFGQVATLPEVEAVITTWQQFEVNKHSRTYTKHLRALYNNPSEVFDESFTDPNLTKISDSISAPYNECYKSVIKYLYFTLNDMRLNKDDMTKIREDFIMAWMEVNILEGIRFYPFFSTLWALDYGHNLMTELKEDLVLIARDENEHLKLTQYTIHKFRKIKGEGFVEIYESLLPKIKERFYEALSEELEWIDYLFSKGSFIGMNANIAKSYVIYLTIRRMRAVGIEPDVDRIGGKMIETNPIPWVDSYINNDEEEKLPQQENVLNYLVNALKNDITPDIKKNILNKYLGV